MDNQDATPKPEAKPDCAPVTCSAAVEKPKPTIEELERILASGEPLDIEIQPDGSIKAVPKGTANNAHPQILELKHVAPTYY
jgi:hypothetical protein